LPNLRGASQVQNAAAVLMAIELLGEAQLPIGQVAVRRGLQEVFLPARFQVFQGAVPVIVDVAHNPQAARELAANLQRFACQGRVHAVAGLLADKDARQVVAAVAPEIASWHLAQLPGPRGASLTELTALVTELATGSSVAGYPNPKSALIGALQCARNGDCILAFGSFLVAGEVLQALENTR
jgi:dihydrofolate synthase/folylpolyglutamate synthase